MLDAEELETTDSIEQKLQGFDAIVVPGGFGVRGIEGMIKAITYARCHNIPFLGICLGLQLAVIEAARTLGGLAQASSSEFGPTSTPVVALLKEWLSEDKVHLHQEEMGGTMRLGASPCTLKEGSKIHAIYGTSLISERHRHRYEVNAHYIPALEQAGVIISGTHKGLVECIERTDHPWFIATQFHPEFKSRPFRPHPLFQSFVEHAAQLEKSERM
jgi:CTP synthase